MSEERTFLIKVPAKPNLGQIIKNRTETELYLIMLI